MIITWTTTSRKFWRPYIMATLLKKKSTQKCGGTQERPQPSQDTKYGYNYANYITEKHSNIKSHQSICRPLMYPIKTSLKRSVMSPTDCACVQVDVALRCPYVRKNTFFVWLCSYSQDITFNSSQSDVRFSHSM